MPSSLGLSGPGSCAAFDTPRAASARQSAREVVARARGQDGERRLRVDRARALVRRECVERLEVARGCRAQSPVAAHDRDRLEPLDERRARPLLGLARPLGLVRVEAHRAARERLTHARPSLARARRRVVDDDEQAGRLTHAGDNFNTGARRATFGAKLYAGRKKINMDGQD